MMAAVRAIEAASYVSRRSKPATTPPPIGAAPDELPGLGLRALCPED
jgi:hypothetical protein